MPPERDDIQIVGFPGAAFKAVCLRQGLPPGFEKLSEPFRRWGRVCHDHGMTPQSTGNLSLRLAVQTLGSKEEVIALQNHGYVAVGASLEEAVRRVLARHEEVLEEIGQGQGLANGVLAFCTTILAASLINSSFSSSCRSGSYSG